MILSLRGPWPARVAWLTPAILLGCSSSTAPVEPVVGCAGIANLAPLTIGSPASFTENPALGSALAVADLNGDGLPDLMQSNHPTMSFLPNPPFLGIYFALPDGGFSAPLKVAGEFGFVAPFDLDGGAAIAVVAKNFAEVDLFDLAGQHVADTGLTGQVEQFAVADVNGDGDPDLVLCEFQQVELRLGPDFQTSVPIVPFTQSLVQCTAIAAGDLNQDGIPDIVHVSGQVQSQPLTVMIADGDGGYAVTSYPIPGIQTGHAIALHDLNGDGRPDIVATNGDGFVVFLNLGMGQFAQGVAYPSGGADRLAIADVNGDCRPDIVVARQVDHLDCQYSQPYNPSLPIFINQGGGTFTDWPPTPDAGPPSYVDPLFPPPPPPVDNSRPFSIDTGLNTPTAIAAYQPAGASLPSIAVLDYCTGKLEIFPSLGSALPDAG